MEINDLSSVMVGKTVAAIHGGTQDSDTMLLIMTDGSAYGFYHEQDCCETVDIADVCGDLTDLIGSPLTLAEEVSSEGEPAPEGSDPDDSYTWTFYKFATNKGGVTVRWLGHSNGYYSESVEMKAFAVGQAVAPEFLEAPVLALPAP